MIECSLHCFVCGLFGLVPIFGLPGSILALVWGVRARRAAQQQWNPADLYLILGHAAAIVGLLLSSVAFGTILVLIAHGLSGDSWFWE